MRLILSRFTRNISFFSDRICQNNGKRVSVPCEFFLRRSFVLLFLSSFLPLLILSCLSPFLFSFLGLHNIWLIADPCAKKVCEHYSRCKATDFTTTECVCPKMSDCPPTRDEVCGSDKVTYYNDCALRVEACTKGEDITVDNLGSCGKRLTCNLKLSFFLPYQYLKSIIYV